MSDQTAYLYQKGWFWLGLLAVAGAVAGYEAVRRSQSAPLEDEYRPRRYIMPQPPVTEITAISTDEAASKLADDDLVLGVALEGRARAYPLKLLEGRPRTKVLNDVLADTPLVVTWCDACAVGTVYDRRMDGRTLTFGVFGSLWRDSMVLMDHETLGQWTQWDGKGRLGPLEGRNLERVPSVVVDWKAWRSRHPQGDVAWLEDEQLEFDPGMYQAADDYVVVAGAGRNLQVWELGELRRQGVLDGHVNGVAVAAVYLEKSGTAVVFETGVGEQTLSLAMQGGVLQDRETASTWDAVTGLALNGPLKGSKLTPVASFVSSKAVSRLFQGY